jgi:DNA-binding beta-propeller fold protein YncE
MKRRRVPFTTTFPFRAALGVALGGLVLTCATLAAQSGGGGQSIPNTNPYSQAFTTFESGQVRPLAFTPDKQLLLATNTPDAKLEVYEVKPNGDLKHVVSVPVGLEPVAVAARTNQEAWVVNHLSDSVSIVKLDGKKSYVTRTLLVGDEPRDIVFAGPNKSKAFITTAHRGQNSPIDPQLSTPGVGRADVWVFDAASAGDSGSMGGIPLTILSFFADTPRALAVTPDGSKVYVAAFNSGNATASTFGATFDGLANPLPPFAPSSQLPFNVNVNFLNQEQPPTSVIVKYDGTHWLDENRHSRSRSRSPTRPMAVEGVHRVSPI